MIDIDFRRSTISRVFSSSYQTQSFHTNIRKLRTEVRHASLENRTIIQRNEKNEGKVQWIDLSSERFNHGKDQSVTWTESSKLDRTHNRIIEKTTYSRKPAIELSQIRFILDSSARTPLQSRLRSKLREDRINLTR